MPDESAQPATKADISLLKADITAVKADLTTVKADITGLDKKIDRVAVALVNTQADVREIRHDMATKDDINRVLNAIDAFAKKSENYDKAVTLHGPILTEVQVGLKDHEKRLNIIESAHP